jgi:carboxypeptidase Q
MAMSKRLLCTAVLIFSTCVSVTRLASQDPAKDHPDFGMLSAIRAEELNHSRVMDHAGWIADVFGPRVTGSENLEKAGQWAQEQMKSWGLVNVHEERFPFGKGWELQHFDANLVEPNYQPLIGFPKSFTPGTKGRITAEVVRVQIDSEEDFVRYRGKLRGKIIVRQPVREVKLLEGTVVQRWTPDLIKEAESTPLIGPSAGGGGSTLVRAAELNSKAQAFFIQEGVVAELDRGIDAYLVRGDNQMSWMTQRADGGTIFVQAGGPFDSANAGKVLPQVTLTVEHYNRILRIMEKNIPVRVELDIAASFRDETAGHENGFNVIGEIPGTDLANEVVMLGAHLDSHQSATGATDNAAGVAVMMEVMRILEAVGAKPRRTIRVALWGGEEEGELGSKAYVRSHFYNTSTNTALPDYKKLSAYYNLDNGTGKIRGVWIQGNFAAEPIFRSWFGSLKDLGVTAIAPRSVAGSDYSQFDDVGLPGFQFMQDRLEYNSRTHHSNMDTVDRLQRDDLAQMAVVVASFAYNTAMQQEMIPRKTFVPEPLKTVSEK